MIETEPKVCARCRHWTPVYTGPVSHWEEPGACHGLNGKWTGLNGSWMKASDGCENWQLSPERARVEIQIPVEPPMDFKADADGEVPF